LRSDSGLRFSRLLGGRRAGRRGERCRRCVELSVAEFAQWTAILLKLSVSNLTTAIAPAFLLEALAVLYCEGLQVLVLRRDLCSGQRRAISVALVVCSTRRGAVAGSVSPGGVGLRLLHVERLEVVFKIATATHQLCHAWILDAIIDFGAVATIELLLQLIHLIVFIQVE